MESNSLKRKVLIDGAEIEITEDLFETIGINKGDAEKINRPNITFWEDVWRRFRKNKLALLGVLIICIISFLAIFGPAISGKDYTFINVANKNLKPSSEFWFGTDVMGRDIFSRVCVGGRISILIGLCCTLVCFTIGSILGGLAGFLGGKVDAFIMRIIEILASVPYLVLVIILSVVIGRSFFSLVFVLSITAWIGTARVIRGQIIQLKEQDFILAARALGADTKLIILRHLLPNTLGVVMVDITLNIPQFIFSESFLSFIGLGIQPPETSWGALASAYQNRLMFNPYQLFFPSLFIVLMILSFHLVGDGLTDALDPKLRK